MGSACSRDDSGNRVLSHPGPSPGDRNALLIPAPGTLDNGTVQSAQLSAPSGQINVVSVGKPSHHNVGGEVVISGSGQGSGFTPTGFASLGAINLTQGSTIDTSGIAGSGHAAGAVLIRGG